MKHISNNVLKGLKNAGKSRFVYFALFFAIVLCLSTVFQPASLLSEIYADSLRTTTDVLNIRADADINSDVIGAVESGSVFESSQERTDSEGRPWILVDYGGVRGYVLAENTRELDGADADDGEDRPKDPDPEEETDEGSDQEPEKKPDDLPETGQEIQQTAHQPAWSGEVQSDEEFELSLLDFPESYRDGLRSVHEVYPNYSFSADYIDMDFEELVDAQVGKKVSAFYASSWKAMYDESFGYYENYDWDTGEWMNSEGDFTYASRETIAHFVDPRNFLNPDDIYMFMRQSYSENQTLDDLRSIIEGSFLSKGYVPDDEENDRRLNGDYAAVLMEAAAISGSSPYVLAASILLEHGFYGETPLISGYYEADDGTVYEGWYNFYDIGATGSDSNNVIQNGLEYAIDHGWNSRYLSITDGAIWITDSYINNGQDTYYYKEYNVINGWDALWHQFSTGVMTAYSSARLLRNTLSQNHYAALDFRIPVYENMPVNPAEEPDYNDNLNNYYFTDMEAAGLEPEFSMANRDYSMTVTEDTVLNIAVPKWAVYEGESSYSLHAGDNPISLDVRSQTGYLRTYNIHITSSGDHVLTVRTHEGNRLKITDGNDSSTDADPDADTDADTDSADDSAQPAAIAAIPVYGDANGDGKISSLDYIAIKNHLMNVLVITDETMLASADANEDGKITVLDYITVKNILMNR